MPEETSPVPWLLLAGERGAGKTTCCLRVACLAREQGWRTGGFVTRTEILRSGAALDLPRFVVAANGSPSPDVRLHLVDLASGEERTLGGAGVGRPDAPDGPRVGRFRMDAEVLAWGIDRTRRAVAEGCDLVILDEVGPLELDQRLGFAPLLDDLIAARGRADGPARLIAVRAWLAEPLRALFDPQPAALVRLDATNRNLLPAEIVSRLAAGQTTPSPPSQGSSRGGLDGNLPATDP